MKTFIVLLFCIATSFAAECPADICERTECAADLQCEENQIKVDNASYCGCCAACITLLDEGELCIGEILLGVPITSMCRSPLVCDDGVCSK